MEVQAYVLASADGKYVAVQRSPHAAIASVEEATNGKHNILVFTSRGKAGQALGTRNIDMLNNWHFGQPMEDYAVLCTKDDLVVTSVKLTLDFSSE